MLNKITTLIVYIFITTMALITLFPFLYMILTSWMTFEQIIAQPMKIIPEELHFLNYVEVLQNSSFFRYFFNTFITATVSTLGMLVTTILATFACVKLDFYGKRVLMVSMIALLMIPDEIVVFSNYQTIAQLGLMNTYTGLVLPSFASVFYIFYLNKFLASMPNSYYNTAKMTGVPDIKFITKVLIPLARPGIFTIGLLSFIEEWHSFIWPILITNDPEMRLLSDGLSSFVIQSDRDIHLQMAAATITVLPILILYFIFRREIIKGVVATGLK